MGYELEITDRRPSVMLGRKRFTPGRYIVTDEAVLADAQRENYPGVYLHFTDETPAGDATVEQVEAYTEPASVGPLTKEKLAAGDDTLRACEVCGRTYRKQHTCPGPDDVGAGDGEVTAENVPSDAPGDDSAAPTDDATPTTDAEPATHCDCPDDCQCLECPSCVAANETPGLSSVDEGLGL